MTLSICFTTSQKGHDYSMKMYLSVKIASMPLVFFFCQILMIVGVSDLLFNQSVPVSLHVHK